MIKIFLIWIILMFSTENLYALQYSREEVIAAYIFNFAQNIEWQNEEKIDQFHFKIISSDKKLIDEINKIGRIKDVKNKQVLVKVENLLSSIDNVHLIFVTKDKGNLLDDIFDKIEGKNILLVSENFADKKKVMINIYESQDYTIKFEINKANIINQGLKVLPDMVLLGGTEIDVAKLYKESQDTLRYKEEQISVLQEHLDSLNILIEVTQKQIEGHHSVIAQQELEILNQKNQMMNLQDESNKLKIAMKNQHDSLSAQTELLRTSQEHLRQHQDEIDRGNEILLRQKEKIDSQNTAIQKQNKILDEKVLTIEAQKNILYLLVVIALLAIGLSYAIYRGYKSKQRSNQQLQEQKNKLQKTLEELEAAENKAQQYLDVARVILIAIDNKMQVTLINQKGSEVLGYKADEIIGKNWFEYFIPEGDRKNVMQTFQLLMSGNTELVEYFENPVLTKNGEERLIAWHNVLLKNESGEIIGALSSGEDVTVQKQSEQQIKNLNKVLQSRAAELETANKELEAFTYSVSHDLRAPLRGIDGFSQILLEEYQDKIDNTGKDYLIRVRSAAQRMGQLIDDMLSLSHVSRFEMKIEKVNLSDLVHNIIVELQSGSPNRKVNFVILENIVVHGDERLLRIALDNLIGNAWKFTSKQQAARIEFGIRYKNSKQIYFIKDNGVGFDMQYAQKLFRAFQRLHSSADFPGIGIGLAIVQRVIDRHGGSIWADSEINKGSTFYFTIA